MGKIPGLHNAGRGPNSGVVYNRRNRYLKVGSALNPRPIVDPKTGIEYPSKGAMRGAQKMAHIHMLANFGRLVEDRTLGQDPWTQLPGESPIQYERFNVYCLMQKREAGRLIKRSITRTAEVVGVNARTLHKVAEHWHWTLRAQCWDREIDRQLHEEFLEEKRISVRSQANLGRRLQQVAMRGAENIMATGGVDMTPGDVARIADVGVKIERLANGDSTANEARKTETRLVWEGPQPKWVGKTTAVTAAHQVERDSRQGATLVQQLSDGEQIAEAEPEGEAT